MYTNMLGCVVAESTHTHIEQFVYKLHIIFLEIGILSVYIRQAAGTLKGTLIAIVVVAYRSKAG